MLEGVSKRHPVWQMGPARVDVEGAGLACRRGLPTWFRSSWIIQNTLASGPPMIGGSDGHASTQECSQEPDSNTVRPRRAGDLET